MENVWRADEILPQDADRAELLALTKEVEDNQIKVPTNIFAGLNTAVDFGSFLKRGIVKSLT